MEIFILINYYLKKFFWWTKKPTPTIDDEEIVARFLFDKKNDLTTENGKSVVKWNALMPYPKNSKDGNRSVSRISRFCFKEIQILCNKEVIEKMKCKNKKKLLGWANINVSDIKKQNSIIIIPDDPPYRHAIIIDWPEERQKRELIAKELAMKASTILNDKFSISNSLE